MNARISSTVSLATSLIGAICPLFDVDVLEFKKIVDTLIEKTEQYAKQVEAERLKVRGLTSAKYRPSDVSGDRSEEHVEVGRQIPRIREATIAIRHQRESHRIRTVSLLECVSTLTHRIFLRQASCRIRIPAEDRTRTKRKDGATITESVRCPSSCTFIASMHLSLSLVAAPEDNPLILIRHFHFSLSMLTHSK